MYGVYPILRSFDLAGIFAKVCGVSAYSQSRHLKVKRSKDQDDRL